VLRTPSVTLCAPGVQNSVEIALFKALRARRLSPRVGRMRTREKTTFCCFLIAGLGKKLSFLAQIHRKISLKIQLSFIIIHLEQRGSRGRKELGASREESLLNLLLYIAVLYIL